MPEWRTDTPVDALAVILMETWEKAEHKPVSPSYVATFADMARAVIRSGWTGETVPLALAIGRIRDGWKAQLRSWEREHERPGYTGTPSIHLHDAFMSLTAVLTTEVGPGPLVEHDERVRARVLGDPLIARIARIAYLDPGRVVKREMNYRGEDYPEPLDCWQARAFDEALRRLRERDGEPL